jgi:hypothetical protein
VARGRPAVHAGQLHGERAERVHGVGAHARHLPRSRTTTSCTTPPTCSRCTTSAATSAP